MSSKIPEARERLMTIADHIDGGAISQKKASREIREIVGRLMIRKPRRKPGGARAVYMTDAMVKRIREYKAQHPTVGPRRIAQMFRTHPERTVAVLENRI